VKLKRKEASRRTYHDARVIRGKASGRAEPPTNKRAGDSEFIKRKKIVVNYAEKAIRGRDDEGQDGSSRRSTGDQRTLDESMEKKYLNEEMKKRPRLERRRARPKSSIDAGRKDVAERIRA